MTDKKPSFQSLTVYLLQLFYYYFCTFSLLLILQAFERIKHVHKLDLIDFSFWITIYSAIFMTLIGNHALNF